MRGRRRFPAQPPNPRAAGYSLTPDLRPASIIPALKAALEADGRAGMLIVVGGAIPAPENVPELKAIGAAPVYPPGTVIPDSALDLIAMREGQVGAGILGADSGVSPPLKIIFSLMRRARIMGVAWLSPFCPLTRPSGRSASAGTAARQRSVSKRPGPFHERSVKAAAMVLVLRSTIS